jgi:hypothetical protein
MKICFIAAVVQTAVLIGHCLQIKYLLGNEEQTALKLLTPGSEIYCGGFSFIIQNY